LHRQGGLGEVWEAQDAELERKVALKHIQDKWADDANFRSRFLAEARITGRLEHPGVVPVYGLGVYADGRPYYAMRFIEGETLGEAIKRFHDANVTSGRDPAERALAFRDLLARFVAICHTIAYAHSRGVLHRDLKPANIMLGHYGETLVVDWGLAKVMEPNPGDPAALSPQGCTGSPTIQGSVVGTVRYMAPEQVAGRLDQIDQRTDVYLLGGVLFEILTGTAPFKDALRGPVPPLPSAVRKPVPPGLEAITTKALQPAREARYGGAAEMAGAVLRWLADEPISTTRDTVARLEREVAQDPTDHHLRDVLAFARFTLALLLAGMQRYVAAESTIQASIGEYEDLIKAYPRILRYQADLAGARLHLSQSLRQQGRLDEADTQEQLAIRTYEQLIAVSPEEGG
jgi:serine/threonine protein kinase